MVAIERDAAAGKLDRPADQALAADSIQIAGSVDQLQGDTVTFTVATEVGRHRKGERISVRVDDNTAYEWIAGLAGGTVFSLSQLERDHGFRPGSSIQVTISDTPGSDTVYVAGRLVLREPN